jgi:phospholipid/cholesterol/gamma-HCH transport system ATP-binding protein
MIELRNIQKTLAGKQVLDGVSLEVKKGETMVIIGASGSGKTVCLKHIVGLLLPDDGVVEVDGVDVAGAGGRELESLRDRFGVLFQSGGLINWMTVGENVALPLQERTNTPPEEIDRLVKEKLGMVGMEGTEEQFPSEISGGMKKRAGLARAIIRNPAVLLYDEPTSGLDPVTSRKIDRLILDLQKELGVTSVVVTHDLHSAVAVGDRIATLHQGKIVDISTPEEFLKSEHPVVSEFRKAQSLEEGEEKNDNPKKA